MAGGGGLLRLHQRIPYQKAMELALTGDSFTAEEAAAWGFVNKLTEPGGALDGALELADRITANGPLAVAVTKEIIASSSEWSADEMWKKQGELLGPVFSSNDAKEGAIAFAEKRAPNWTGSDAGGQERSDREIVCAMDLGFAGAAAVVVGGGRGMGFATAQCLAEDGARIAIVGRSARRTRRCRNGAGPPGIAGGGGDRRRYLGQLPGRAGLRRRGRAVG